MTPLAAVLGARTPDAHGLVDVHLRDGRIDDVLPAGVRAPGGPAVHARGRVVLPGLIDAHLHLDKALLADRLQGAEGGLPDAMRATAALKPTFTLRDVQARAERVLGRLADRGVTAARVHVEVDPILRLTGVEAHLELRERWAGRVALQLVAFPQEGALRDPATASLLDDAMRAGCDVVGACPYADPDGPAAVRDAFDRAERFGAPLDFHVDFTDDPSVHLVDDVCEMAAARGMQGRVAVGHVTSLAAMASAVAAPRIAQLAAAGVGVIALPATDLYLSGRDADGLAPRGLTRVLELLDAGVPVALSTNNHVNAFTPVSSDPILLTWLTMLLAHAPHGRWRDLLRCVTEHPATILGTDGGVLAPGAPADLLLLACEDPSEVVTGVPATVAVVCGGCLAELHDDAVRALDVDVAPA